MSRTIQSVLDRITAAGRVFTRLGERRTWTHLVRSTTVNSPLVLDLVDFATAGDRRSERRKALERILDRLYYRSLVGDISDAEVDLKGIVPKMLAANKWLPEQLRSVPHLGALGKLSYSGSRWQYVLLANRVLFQLKQTYPGLQLGSFRLPAPESPRTKLSGLELAQLWVLLTNAGHLFGTFATERALLYELKRDQNLERRFLSEIAEPIRVHSEAILRRGQIHEFFYALSALRTTRMMHSNPYYSTAIEALRLFFEAREAARDESAMWAFRTARQVAYNRMHLYLRAGVSLDAVHGGDALDDLLPYREIGYDPDIYDEDSSLRKALATVDTYQLELFFTGARAARIVLSHLASFRAWWRIQHVRPESLTKHIDALYRVPFDWPVRQFGALRHFVRLRVPGAPATWREEVEAWQAERVWDDGAFLVSPVRDQESLVCDVYHNVDGPDARLLVATASQLARHTVGSWKTDSPGPAERRLWRSAAVFGCRVLQLILRPELRPIVLPASTDGSHATYAIVARGDWRDQALQRMGAIGSSIDDDGDTRARELEATADALGDLVEKYGDAPWLVFLGELKILEGNKEESWTTVGEIDGAIVFFLRDGLDFFFIEHKKTRGGGRSQLESTLERCFVPAAQPVAVQCSRGKISGRQIMWRRRPH